ncbi:MAG: sce7726 family protein ['Candidatus Kapabacteria' thiocyanatum]|nr:sce7726 family protein ['Candidatus Kapabacteria' thiocyanatum]
MGNTLEWLAVGFHVDKPTCASIAFDVSAAGSPGLRTVVYGTYSGPFSCVSCHWYLLSPLDAGFNPRLSFQGTQQWNDTMNTQRKTIANDKVLRVRSENRLRRAARNTSTVIVHELGVSYGEHRVDIATVNRRCLSGYEIKSDVDTLARLPKQASSFSSVFDRMTLVVVPKHLQTARNMVPDWWSIVVDDGIAYHCERQGQQNPNVCATTSLQLLWKSELVSTIESLGLGQGSVARVHKPKLLELLLAEVSSKMISTIVRKVLWQRLSTKLDRRSRSCDDSFLHVATAAYSQWEVSPSWE